MDRRDFLGLAAASFTGAALRMDAATVSAEPSVTLNLRGWRATFDSAGRLLSFTNGQTELVNQDLTAYSTHILYRGSALNLCNTPVRSNGGPASISFEYEFSTPHPLRVVIESELLDLGAGAVAFKRQVTLHAERAIKESVVVQVPTPLQLPQPLRNVFLPMKNGVGRRKQIRGLDNEDNYVYEFAGACAFGRNQLLALPMVHEYADNSNLRLTHVTDPLFTSLLRLPFARQAGQWQWVYPQKPGLPAGKHERSYFAIVHEGGPEQAIDLFYRTALADVKPGPAWLHDIALVNYDYLSKNGKGWFADIEKLTEAIAPSDRQKVALVLHGWYDLVGQYTYDPRTQSLAESWTAFPSARTPSTQSLGRDPDEGGLPSMLLTPGYRWKSDSVKALQPVPLTLQEMHRRIRFAKDRGFRVLLYFADGLNGCDDSPLYSPDEVLSLGGWRGPDTTGNTYARNPLHPNVRSFYLGYTKVLLAEYGNEVDGFVWDETNCAPADAIGPDAHPGYAAVAMMTLMKEVAAIVATHPELALFASDCSGVANDLHVPPYALMAHGTYQDSHCRPESWPYSLFPNYRNTVWSCNWAPVSNHRFMQFGVDNFDTPVSIGNGSFGDDTGFSDMTPELAGLIVELFNRRKTRKMRLHWIEESDRSGRYGDRTLDNTFNIL
jgi:hypothetical protein